MFDESVTYWIERLKEGDEQAATRIWQRFFEKLVHFAARRLSGSNRRVADEEDVVLSAFDTFYRNAAAGRFPDLNDRDGLWKLLFAIVDRKSLDYIKFETRQKRGGGNVRGDSVFLSGKEASSNQPVGLVSREPTPEFAAEVAEQIEKLLGDLQSDSLSEVALMKMQGFTNQEISEQLNCSERSVTRRLKLIRMVWMDRLK